MRNKRILALSVKSESVKSLLMKWVISNYGLWLGGFTTREIKTGGKRTGYEISALNGESEVLASVGIISDLKINKYAVNPGALSLAARAVKRALKEGKIVLMDEIGPISLKSSELAASAVKVLSSGAPALVALRRGARAFEKTLEEISEADFARVGGEDLFRAKKILGEWFDFAIRLAAGRKES